jgi:hypothetical protein
MSEIKVVRLTNGDHMVCNLSEHDDDNVLVSMGFVLNADSSTGRILYQPFAPWSSAAGEVVVKKDSITFISQPASFVIDQYQDLLDGKLLPANANQNPPE